jgi:hypothetical protein
MTSRDQDIHKGATEDERPSATTNAPGWTTMGCRMMSWRSRNLRLAREKTDRRDNLYQWPGDGLGGVGMVLSERED